MHQSNGGAERRCLVWGTGAMRGQKVPLNQGFVVIGRDLSCGITLDADIVAGRHATLEVNWSGEAILVDLASFSGTYVNGEAITRRELRDGDRIHFGPGSEICLTYHAGARESVGAEQGGFAAPENSAEAEEGVACESCGEVIDSPDEAIVFCPFCGNQQGGGSAGESATAAAAAGRDINTEPDQRPAPSAATASAQEAYAADPAPGSTRWDDELANEPAAPPSELPDVAAAPSGDIGDDGERPADHESLVPEPFAPRLMRELMADLFEFYGEMGGHRALLDKYNRQADGLNGEYANLRSTMQQYLGSATESMQSRGFAVFDAPQLSPSPSGPPSSPPRGQGGVESKLQDARHALSAAGGLATELHRMQGPPRAIIFPNDGAIGILIIVLSLMAGVVAGVLTFNVGLRDISLLIGFLCSAGAYVAGMIYLHTSATSALRHKFADFAEAFRNADRQTEAYRQVASAQVQADRAAEIADFKGRMRARLDELKSRWLTYSACAGVAGADWDHDIWGRWSPVRKFSPVGSLGWFFTPTQAVAPEFAEVEMDFSLPALAPFSEGKVLLLNAGGEQKPTAVGAVQSVLLRMLATTAPGKLRFTVIDPIGLGQSVSHLVALAKYDDSLVDGKVWSEPQHIEQRLALITEHMENVIQKYLRNEYESVGQYNEKAKVPVPYRVLTVFDFPANFSDNATRRLLSIARNGPRCGVYTIVVRDESQKSPYGFSHHELEQYAMRCSYNEGHGCWHWDEKPYDHFGLRLWGEPPKEVAERLVREHGELFKDASRVSVPYSDLLAGEGLDQSPWSGSTKDRIKVPLGPKDAQSLQQLTFGESGSAHHAVVIGKTGSGKSNLMHVIITTLALKYSPEEIQLYLIDFKQGVEFKEYAEHALPHARVIAIKSEREFGISVLEGLNKELNRRGDQFRDLAVNSIAAYRQKTGEPLPRILLLVDEYQEFFSAGDNIASQASQILDRLVRQGRSYGIHVMLGSQNLSGGRDANLSSSTLNQMAIRIALQCSDSDARQILADDNPAARSLSRPGEAVYNSDNGRVEGNSFFQVAEIKDEERKSHLDRIRRLADSRGFGAKPIVFEGDQPARLEECEPLLGVLDGTVVPASGRYVETWIGQPVAISPPTLVRFRRQSGAHLLIVCREEEDGVGTLTAAVVGIASQSRFTGAQIILADFTSDDSPCAEAASRVASAFPGVVQTIGRREVVRKLKTLAGEISRRIEQGGTGGKPIFLVVQGLQYARDLRLDEDDYYRKGDDAEPSATELLTTVLREGPEAGIHLVAWCDTYANAMRVMNRKMMREVGMRVAGAMSNEDSQNFIEDAAASRIDKPHRAIFAQEERPGQLEKFRTYATPDGGWLSRASEGPRGTGGRAAPTNGG